MVVGGVRVQREAGDVARAPEIGLSRHAAAIVHGQVAARVRLDAHVLETDAIQVGSLACRDDHPLDRRGPPVVEREPRTARGGHHARDVHAQPHVDAVLAQRRRERRRHRRLFAGQELRRVLDQRHATAEAGEHLGDLAPHGPAADDDGGGRQLVTRIEVLAGPGGHGGEPGDARLPETGAGGDDQVAPADAGSAGGEDARSLDATPGLDHADALVLEVPDGAGVVAMLGDDVPAGHGGGVGLPVAVQRERTADGAEPSRPSG